MHEGKRSECFVMDVHAVEGIRKHVLIAYIVLLFLLEIMLHAMIVLPGILGLKRRGRRRI